MLKRSKWKLNLPLNTAWKNCPSVIVALNDSQCLRFIDEINGAKNVNEDIFELQKKIRATKKKPKSKENKQLIGNYYNTLYHLQFQKDYVCVVMNSKQDYDRANQGFSITYEEGLTINYRRLLGTNGGIKNSTIVYVNTLLYDEIKHKLDNGRKLDMKLVPAKLEAYQALICSGSIPLPMPKGFIVVKDCITKFKEDVYVIDDSDVGEPKLSFEKDYEIEHNGSDGFGLMSPEYSRIANEYLTGCKDTLSGMTVRYAWTKGMLYTMDFIEFAENVAGSYEVMDVWGHKRDVREADVILTESMLKLWESYDSWEDYYENCRKNNYEFSVTKTTPQELENVRDTNYQFLQSYQFTDDDIKELCQPTVDEIKSVIGLDYRKSLAFLAGFSLNEDNCFGDNIENYVKALMIDSDMINDPFLRRKIYSMIRKRIEMGERGAIRINANFAMIGGDPYALLQSMWEMNVTGLLSAGEVYHKYWIDKGANEIACFRAPMTISNNITKLRLNKNETISHWFRFLKTVCILNDWDSTGESANGADFDGDTFFCTDNPVILKRTEDLPTIVCLQKRAEKAIPTEENIIESNKLAFSDEIGEVTNHVTAMIVVRDRFPIDSIEYKTLSYRIMCGQLYQQNTIDRAKGIIAKSMPEYWYSLRSNKVSEDDSAEEIARKQLNEKIAATKKPYFMCYVYPQLKSENNKYIKNNNKSAIRRFGKLGISCVEDIRTYRDKTQEMIEFLDYYDRLSPVDCGYSTINRICWFFEEAFRECLSKISLYMVTLTQQSFDYRVLQSNVEYSRISYEAILGVYRDYKNKVAKHECDSIVRRVSSEQDYVEYSILVNYFRSRCLELCSNEEELCNIVLDLCYQTEHSKQFAWDICGDVIIKNLLKKNDNIIFFPEVVSGSGEFEYCGRQFEMRKKILGVIDDEINTNESHSLKVS